jgi:hypothetical protein
MCKNKTDAGVTPHLYLCGNDDHTVHRQAEKKKKEMERWLELVKETAVDCPLQNKNQNQKCFVPPQAYKSKLYTVQGAKRLVYHAVPVVKGNRKWVQLFEDEDGKKALGFEVFDKDDENEVGDPEFYNDQEQPVDSLAELLTPPSNAAVRRKKIKIQTQTGVHFVYVDKTSGMVAMYKDKDTDNESLYGYIDFGPPRTFYDELRQPTTLEKIFITKKL